MMKTKNSQRAAIAALVLLLVLLLSASFAGGRWHARRLTTLVVGEDEPADPFLVPHAYIREVTLIGTSAMLTPSGREQPPTPSRPFTNWSSVEVSCMASTLCFEAWHWEHVIRTIDTTGKGDLVRTFFLAPREENGRKYVPEIANIYPSIFCGFTRHVTHVGLHLSIGTTYPFVPSGPKWDPPPEAVGRMLVEYSWDKGKTWHEWMHQETHRDYAIAFIPVPENANPHLCLRFTAEDPVAENHRTGIRSLRLIGFSPPDSDHQGDR